LLSNVHTAALADIKDHSHSYNDGSKKHSEAVCYHKFIRTIKFWNFQYHKTSLSHIMQLIISSVILFSFHYY